MINSITGIPVIHFSNKRHQIIFYLYCGTFNLIAIIGWFLWNPIGSKQSQSNNNSLVAMIIQLDIKYCQPFYYLYNAFNLYVNGQMIGFQLESTCFKEINEKTFKWKWFILFLIYLFSFYSLYFIEFLLSSAHLNWTVKSQVFGLIVIFIIHVQYSFNIVILLYSQYIVKYRFNEIHKQMNQLCFKNALDWHPQIDQLFDDVIDLNRFSDQFNRFSSTVYLIFSMNQIQEIVVTAALYIISGQFILSPLIGLLLNVSVFCILIKWNQNGIQQQKTLFEQLQVHLSQSPTTSKQLFKTFDQYSSERICCIVMSNFYKNELKMRIHRMSTIGYKSMINCFLIALGNVLLFMQTYH